MKIKFQTMGELRKFLFIPPNYDFSAVTFCRKYGAQSKIRLKSFFNQM